MDYGITTCSKHNYAGTSVVCPYCYQEQNDISALTAENKRLRDGVRELSELWEQFRDYDNVLPFELMDVEELELLNKITAAITRIQEGDRGPM